MKVTKIFAGLLALVLVMAGAIPARAESLAVAVDLKAAKVFNFNMGSVNNFVYTGSNSGWNLTLGGKSDTGNASAAAVVSTGLNSSSTRIGIADYGTGPRAVNLGEEEGNSINSAGLIWWLFHHNPIAIAADINLAKVDNINMGAVMNFVYTGANTGLNWTFGGKSDTGKATANSNVSTDLNSSDTTIAICDFESGPMAVNWMEKEDDCQLPGSFCDLGGCCPGPGPGRPHALAAALDLTAVAVHNFNSGFVLNLVATDANSGRNLTLGGKSDTGDAEAESSVATTMNSSTTRISVMEGGTGPMAANVNTGSLALAAQADLVLVTNRNYGAVLNAVSTSANTGENMTGGKKASSDTGNATASSSVASNVNSNNTSVSVANLGSGPVAANVDSGDTCSGPCSDPCIDPCNPQLPDICGPSVCGQPVIAGGATAVNSGEGTAVSADVTAVVVSNNNVATVNNAVVTTANTGDNVTAGGCGGNASSDTGNASATSTVTNTVNTNSTTVEIGFSD